MARKRNQDARRRELLDAAVSVINERGPAGVQMKDVARAANMATGSIYYYYDGVDELLRHVHQMAFERYLTRRAEAVAEVDDPRAQLAIMVALGLPTPADEPLSLALYQVEVAKARDAHHNELITELCGSQRRLYQDILERGAERGVFDLLLPALDIAEQLISLEDGYGIGICAGKKDYTYERTHALVLDAAALWTSCPDLGDWLPATPGHVSRLSRAEGAVPDGS
jgi:AcrR family transcriptional regulator